MNRDCITVLVLVVLLISSILGCKTSGSISTFHPPQQIHFGNGGGFAGIIKHYILHRDGRVLFKISRDTIYHHIATVDGQVTAQMFDNYSALDISDLTLNSPGNMYCYLYGDNIDKSKKLVWDQENPENTTVDLYLNTLLSIVHKYKLTNE